eukprot:TRINITY_DN87711_c0_g1_i1.p1 TRINITY_DN87711_c0_g1~~TRINITY_DN87711_c0_g1_i1.p1  ORF type:complete len:182 (-),score=11.43 TRINITY_DN87711_c0_g1_i1:73-618(-)
MAASSQHAWHLSLVLLLAVVVSSFANDSSDFADGDRRLTRYYYDDDYYEDDMGATVGGIIYQLGVFAVRAAIFAYASYWCWKKHMQIKAAGLEPSCGPTTVICCLCCTCLAACWNVDAIQATVMQPGGYVVGGPVAIGQPVSAPPPVVGQPVQATAAPQGQVIQAQVVQATVVQDNGNANA